MQTHEPIDVLDHAATDDAANAAALISARGLTKRFGEFTAVDAIDFEVARGEAFGFLGPNGAGKTFDHADDRLRRARRAQAGCGSSASTRPTDGPPIRARLGVVPQQDTLDLELTVRENLLIYGRYFGMSRVDAASEDRRAAGVRAAHRARPTRSSRCPAG